MLKFLIEFLSKSNWPIAILCFVTAATFWFLNALNKGGYNNVVEYPLEFNYQDSDLIETETLPDHLSIAVSGNGWNLLRKTAFFRRDPIEIRLADPVNTDWVLASNYRPELLSQLGNSVNLDAILTDTLFINLEEEAQKSVALKLDLDVLDFREDHRIVSAIEIDADSLFFTGPTSFIDSLKNTFLLKVSERGISRNFEEDVEIPLPSALIDVQPQSVNVSFRVAEFVLLEKIFSVKLQKQLSDSSLIVQDSSIMITFRVDENETEILEGIDLGLELDLSTVNSIGNFWPTISNNITLDSLKSIIEIDSIAPINVILRPNL